MYSQTTSSTWGRYKKSPVIDQMSFLASASSCVESCRGVEEQSSSDSELEELLALLLGLVYPGSSGGSQTLISSPETRTVPSATGHMKLPLLSSVNTSFALSLQAWSSDAFICSNSSMSVIHTSPFQILTACITHIQRICLERLLSQIDAVSEGLSHKRVIFDDCSRRYYWSVKGISEPVSYSVFTSDKTSWMDRRKQLHSIESVDHSSSRPDSNSTADGPSFTPRTALSAIPFVSGLDAQWFQDISSQDLLLNFKELSV